MPRSTAIALVLALTTGLASAQDTLNANSNYNNVGDVQWGLLFDVEAYSRPLTVIGLRTAVEAPPGVLVAIEVFTRSGTGLGGDATSGPGSSADGWTSHGIVTGQLASGSNAFLEVEFPGIDLAPGEIKGVCVKFRNSKPRFFGQGSNSLRSFSDGTLGLTTGDVRSEPLTAGGLFESSRELVGSLSYVDDLNGPLQTNYCGPAVPNVTGVPGRIRANGSAALFVNDISLTASSLPPQAFGFFIASLTEGFIPMAGASSGNLCLGGSIGRYVGPGQVQSTGGTGRFSIDLDLTLMPQPTGFVAAARSDTWRFQAWYRDLSGGSATSNFTDGLAITLY